MRHYIQHPPGIPLRYRLGEKVRKPAQTRFTYRIGLRFLSANRIEPGKIILINYPDFPQVGIITGVVMWCEKIDDNYEIGVRFCDHRNAFRIRILEQLCHIEKYRQERRESEGRNLSREEAAREWISRYAYNFPAYNL